MGFLQELLNANEENLKEILEEGWLLDWMERARDQIYSLGSIPEFCLQKLFILFSSSVFLPLAIQLLSLAMRVTCITLPDFPLQVVESNDTAPPNSMFQAPGRRRRPRMEALQYLGIVQVFSFSNQFQSCRHCPGDDWGNG